MKKSSSVILSADVINHKNLINILFVRIEENSALTTCQNSQPVDQKALIFSIHPVLLQDTIVRNSLSFTMIEINYFSCMVLTNFPQYFSAASVLLLTLSFL